MKSLLLLLLFNYYLLTYFFKFKNKVSRINLLKNEEGMNLLPLPTYDQDYIEKLNDKIMNKMEEFSLLLKSSLGLLF